MSGASRIPKEKIPVFETKRDQLVEVTKEVGDYNCRI